VKISQLSPFTIILGSLFLNSSLALAQSQTLNSCEPIGRVRASSDPNFRVGSQLCVGQAKSFTNNRNVSLFCYWSAKTLSLFDISWHPDICPLTKLVVPCPDGSGENCSRDRGMAKNPNNPKILTPYGNKLINGRPSFSWSRVPGATNYVVQVRSADKGWERGIGQSSTLPYPQGEESLESGVSYRVKISVYNKDTFITSFSKRLIIISNEEKKQINLDIANIISLHLPQEESVFRDIFAVYSSRGLIDEQIKTLKARIAAGGKDPGLRRALGDSYISTGLLDYAFKEYEVATTLAKKSNNNLELSKARSGILFVSLMK
jgi:hypothetical protein